MRPWAGKSHKTCSQLPCNGEIVMCSFGCRVGSGSRNSLLMARASLSFGMTLTSCCRLIQCGAPCVLFLAVASLQAKFPAALD